MPYIFQTTYIQYIPLDARKIKVYFFLQVCFYRSSFQFLAYPSQGVAGAAIEHPLEKVESNEVRTRGRLPPSIQKKEIVYPNYKGEVIKHDMTKYVPETEYVVKVLERHVEKAKHNLKGAPIVVAGGYGMGSKENECVIFFPVN